LDVAIELVSKFRGRRAALPLFQNLVVCDLWLRARARATVIPCRLSESITACVCMCARDSAPRSYFLGTACSGFRTCSATSTSSAYGHLAARAPTRPPAPHNFALEHATPPPRRRHRREGEAGRVARRRRRPRRPPLWHRPRPAGWRPRN
jgi:hypothetical protein